VLDWFERAAEGDEPLDVAFLEGDTATRDALVGRGYELAEDEGFLHHMAADLAEKPELPPLPNGYRLEAVASGVGELEPVGTDSAHRRIGLGRAVCLEALRRLRELGATLGLVYSVDGEPSTALYRSVGFRSIDRHVQYRLPR
jgi:ribosomal protein S18 acetylase RimI-like enzyme